MIVLIGESACGKSTIEKILEKEYGMKRVISHTTRPERHGEKDGVDYFFVSNYDFNKKLKNKEFAETGSYNGWLYGSEKDQYYDNSVVVLTPKGYRQLKKNLKMNNKIFAIYIKVDRKSRLIKSLERGDNIEEIIRRNQTDVGQYDGVEDEVDFVISNEEYLYTPKYLAKVIFNLCSGVGTGGKNENESA